MRSSIMICIDTLVQSLHRPERGALTHHKSAVRPLFCMLMLFFSFLRFIWEKGGGGRKCYGDCLTTPGRGMYGQAFSIWPGVP